MERYSAAIGLAHVSGGHARVTYLLQKLLRKKSSTGDPTMSFDGRTIVSSSSFDYSRTFLTQLPPNVKNRNMEASRQTLRTSSDAYGRFWVIDASAKRSTLTASTTTDSTQGPSSTRLLPSFKYVFVAYINRTISRLFPTYAVQATVLCDSTTAENRTLNRSVGKWY